MGGFVGGLVSHKVAISTTTGAGATMETRLAVDRSV